jgi:hypothetical protein
MRTTPRALLAVIVAASLAVVFVRCPTRPIDPLPFPDGDPEARARAAGYPDLVPLRSQAKEVVAREVIAGRRSLLQAAALFRELDRLPPGPFDLARLDGADAAAPIPGRTDDERYCRHVLAWVRTILNDAPPGRTEATVAQLGAEFHDVLRREGTVRLPDPSTLEPVDELLKRAWAELPAAQQQALLGRGRAGD